MRITNISVCRSAFYVWSSGFFCSLSDGLELSTKIPTQAFLQDCHFWTFKNFFQSIKVVGKLLLLRMLHAITLLVECYVMFEFVFLKIMYILYFASRAANKLKPITAMTEIFRFFNSGYAHDRNISILRRRAFLRTENTLIKPNYASVRQSRDSLHRDTDNVTKKVAAAPCSETVRS